MNNIVKFRDKELHTYDFNGLPWLSSVELANGLGYADESAVTRIYNRHSDEFTSDMVQTVKLTVRGLQRQIKVFSPRGCHLVAMFAKTPFAKAFRKWVLDVLDKKASDRIVEVAPHTRSLPSGKKEIVLSAKAREEIGGITKAVVGKALEGCKVVEYVNPIKNILSDDLLTEPSLTPMEIENHIGHLLTGLEDYKKSSADMYKLYRLLEACKALACRYHSYANHLQGGVDFCEYYRGKNVKYFELNTDALYATVRGMLDTKIELSAL